MSSARIQCTASKTAVDSTKFKVHTSQVYLKVGKEFKKVGGSLPRQAFQTLWLSVLQCTVHSARSASLQPFSKYHCEVQHLEDSGCVKLNTWHCPSVCLFCLSVWDVWWSVHQSVQRFPTLLWTFNSKSLFHFASPLSFIFLFQLFRWIKPALLFYDPSGYWWCSRRHWLIMEACLKLQPD